MRRLSNNFENEDIVESVVWRDDEHQLDLLEFLEALLEREEEDGQSL